MIGLGLTFLALAASAAAAKGFADDREYVYNHTGIVYTRHSGDSPQYAGYAYYVKCIIQSRGDYLIFKAEEVTKAPFNGQFEDAASASHEFTDLPAHAEFLTRPFRATRKNGIVTKLEVTRDEPTFSVNLKRAVVLLFSLDLDPPVSREDSYYKTYEEGMHGDCETTYVVGDHDRSSDATVLNVTKLQNLHRCRSRPNQLYTSFRRQECGNDELEEPHILHGSIQHQYSLRGDRHNYVIDRIDVESDVTYSPHLLHGESLSTTIKRSFEFVEERAIVNPLKLSDDLVGHTSFLYDFHFQRDFRDPVDLKETHYLYHMPGIKIPTSAIVDMLLELRSVQFDRRRERDVEDKNTPAKFVELLRAVSTLAYDEIADLYKTYTAHSDEGEGKRYGNLFVDVLASVGTNPAFLFAKHLIENNKISPTEARYLLLQLTLHLKEVSQVLMDNFQELCESRNVKKRPELHIQCVTSLSDLVFEHCVPRRQPENILKTGKTVCPYDAALKYFNYIARLHEKAAAENLRMAYVKAAGTTGVKEALPLLAPCVTGTDCHNLLQRDNAIWALENVGREHPEEVRKLLFPLFFNRTENYVVRLDAFILLLRLSPELHEVEGMARELKDDPDDQVRSYAYSTLKTLANSTHACDAQLSSDARYALGILQNVREEFEKYDHSYSKPDLFGLHSRSYDTRGFDRFAYFASDTGYIPRKMYLSLGDFSLGIGLNQFGLEKFLDRILGPPSPGQSSKKELDGIKAKMNLPLHDYEPVRGEIYLRHLGRHHSSYYFDDSTLEDLFETGRYWLYNASSDLSLQQFHCQRFTLEEDRLHVLPTELGIPLLLDYKQPVYYHYSNYDSSLKFERSSTEQLPDHVKANMNGHFVIDRNLITYMAADVAYDLVDVGAGIHRRSTLSLPLKLNLDLAAGERRMKLKWTPVAPHDVYHFRYEPFTFIDSYVNGVPQAMEEGYSPAGKVRREMQQDALHDLLGVGLNVKAEYESEFKESWMDFLFERSSRHHTHQPCNVHVQLTNKENDSTTGVDVELSFQHHENGWTIPHFPEENFENYDREKEERGPLHTCVLKTDVKTYGTRARKVHAVTTWTRDLLKTFHKLDFYYEKTLTESDKAETEKVCASSYLKYPKYDLQKFATLDTLDLEHAVHSGMKVHFGEDCKSDQKFEVSGLFTTTEEQKEFERNREDPDTPEHYNQYSRWYHQCQDEWKRGVHYAEGCMMYQRVATTLHKYAFHIKHENLSPAFLNATYLLDRTLGFMMFAHSDHNVIDVQNPVDEVHIEANFSSRLPVADIRMQKPTSNSNYDSVRFPSYVGFSSYPMLEDMHVKDSFSDLYCGLDGNEIFTFDRLNYILPPTDCHQVVLAKDCSPKELFTVLATTTNHTRYHKAVKVFLGDHEIELLPEDSDIVVNVDGRRVPVGKDEPYLHKEERDEILFYVTFRDSYYALHSEKYGLIVEHDADGVFVQVSPYYRAKLCGLCGNYNGQRYDGAMTPEGGCRYKDEKSYAYAYTVPSETCSVPRPELTCDNPLLKNDLAEITRMGV